MKNALSIFLVLLSSFLSAQERKFQIGITGSADVAYRSLFVVDDLPFNQENINYRNDFETPKIGYSGGLHFAYQISEKFKILAGIQHSNMGYKLSGLHLNSVQFENIDPRRNGFIYPHDLQSIFNFHYVEVPVGIQYQLGKKKWKPTLAIGLSPGYLINTTKTELWSSADGSMNEEKSDLNLSSIERFSLTPFANLGVNYHLNKTWSIQASAQFRYNLFTVFDEPISTNLWNAGIQVGCFHNL